MTLIYFKLGVCVCACLVVKENIEKKTGGKLDKELTIVCSIERGLYFQRFLFSLCILLCINR